MVKPRGKVQRSGFSLGAIGLAVESVDIAAWCPDEKAKAPPEQVHLILRVKGIDYPFIIRFKSPDTLGFLIEELADYRREVWPDAERIKLAGGELQEAQRVIRELARLIAGWEMVAAVPANIQRRAESIAGADFSG